jgi:hypothetical protein
MEPGGRGVSIARFDFRDRMLQHLGDIRVRLRRNLQETVVVLAENHDGAWGKGSEY